MAVNEDDVNVKGTGDGLIISFKAQKWEEMHSSLMMRINENTPFFENARIALEVKETEIKAAEMGRLCDDLASRHIRLWAILSTSDATLKNAQTFGIPTQLGLKKSNGVKEESLTFDGEAAIWIEKTLRAGYRIETKCHVIVMGDINPGSEVISAGNILVMGKIGGAVHAGAEGDRKAKVYALQMRPTQLRIADITALPITGKIKAQSEIAFIEDDKISIKNWMSLKPS